MATTMYTPDQCMLCRVEPKPMPVDSQSLARWEAGALIQHAFPSLSEDQRELIKSGIHPACWDGAFGGMEDD